MSLLRGAQTPSTSPPSFHTHQRPPLRVLASGTVFLTHTLLVASYPEAGGVARAQSVQKVRGGHGANVLTVLAQFRAVRPQVPGNPFSPAGARCVGELQFCGPLAGNEEGVLVARELESQRVGTRFCMVREGKSVPAAWVVKAGDGTKTVINHNPLPDMTHDEFVSRLGPILAPENYDLPSPSPPILPPPPSVSPPYSHTRRRSGSGHHALVHGSPSSPPNGQSSYHSGTPPFDWIHFEGRALQTTMANMTGLDGLARERAWRAHSVFSLEVARGGVEALIPHADVVFFSKPYALSLSARDTPTSPRSFLVAMSAQAALHALLVVDWGAQGAALLSVPTREYLQSSGWVDPSNGNGVSIPMTAAEVVGSVRTASGFWADGRPGSGVTVTGSEGTPSNWTGSDARAAAASRRTSTSTEMGADATMLDEVGAHEAFVAGMMFALSQRVLPGRPYTPSGAGGPNVGTTAGSGRWRLEECLRFATELAGRKGRRADFAGLRTEMEHAGWVLE